LVGEGEDVGEDLRDGHRDLSAGRTFGFLGRHEAGVRVIHGVENQSGV
jgi:hypothetical protein